MFQYTARSEQGKIKENPSSNKENTSKLDLGEMLKGHANVPNLGGQPAQMMVKEQQELKAVNNSTGVLIKDKDALNLLKLGLSSEEAQFVLLNSNGFIDVTKLKLGESTITVGGNYKALLEIAQSSKTVEIIVSYVEEGINGNNVKVSGKDVPFQFQECKNIARDFWQINGGADDFSGKVQINGKELNFEEFNKYMDLQDKYTPSVGLGKTSAPFGTQPNTEFDRRLGEKLKPEHKIFSTNENYQVYVNKYLLDHPETIGKAVQTLAHELYGHLYAMFKGTSSSHGSVRKKGDNATKWNYNEDLENRILERTEEATDNYNKRK